MNFFLKYITILLFFVLASCYQVPHYQRTPNQGWTENGVETYPRVDVIRRKKDIQLPLAFQQAVQSYYQKYGFWPPSLQVFSRESSSNASLVKVLEQQGFAKMEFLPIGTSRDSLALEFVFVKQRKIYYDTDASVSINPTNTGRFIFFVDSSGYIYCRRHLSKLTDGERSKWILD